MSIESVMPFNHLMLFHPPSPFVLNLSFLYIYIIHINNYIHIVKAMVFPVVMYGCESWTIKKAECFEELMLLNCGVGEDS